MRLHDVTLAQLWREIVIRCALRLMRPYLPFYVRGVNDADLTVYVIVSEDEATYRRNFTVGPRYHTDPRYQTEAIQ